MSKKPQKEETSKTSIQNQQKTKKTRPYIQTKKSYEQINRAMRFGLR